MIRSGIVLSLLTFVGFSVFCISIEAPLIQDDILKRSQDLLLAHHIPISGLSVNGRDVILTGPSDSVLTSPHTLHLLEQMKGVRVVTVRHQDGASDAYPDSSLRPSGNTQQHEIQQKVDGVLQNKEISFERGTAVLTPESEALLDRISSLLLEASSLQCDIRGYYDAGTDSRDNWTLALQRTLAVEDYLISKGVAEWRLSTHASQAGELSDRRPANRIVDLLVEVR